MTRILGIDPGSRTTGFGLIDAVNGQYRYVSSGCIRTGDNAFPQRLKTIFHGVSEVILEFKPDVFAVEKVFVKQNVVSALKLGQARGAAICAGVVSDLPVEEYAPTEVKRAIVGVGRANKDQVQHMVLSMLGLSGELQEDASDALAIALCHGHLSKSRQRLALAGRG